LTNERSYLAASSRMALHLTSWGERRTFSLCCRIFPPTYFIYFVIFFSLLVSPLWNRIYNNWS